MTEQPTEDVEAKDLREGFARELELQMISVLGRVEALIEMHDRYGDTLQKDYLYKARRALKDGLGWFDWSRKQRRA